MKKHIAMITSTMLALAVMTGCASEPSKTASSQEISSEAVTQTEASSEAKETETKAEPESASGEEQKETIKGQAVSIENNGHSIPGILTMPEDIPEGETVPAVLMLHGTGSDKNEAGGGYVMMADAFAKAGIASLRIDFMGSGESAADYAEYCNTTAISDANAAGVFLSQQEGIDPTHIGIMGWSQGGTDTLLTAAQSDLFKSVLTWAGAMDLTGLMNDEMYQEAQENGYAVMEFDWREPLHLGLQWMDEVKSTDMNEVVSKIQAPVLAINGSEDTVVLPENAEKIKELSPNEDSQVMILEGADHTFCVFEEDHTIFNELMEKTVEWFLNTL